MRICVVDTLRRPVVSTPEVLHAKARLIMRAMDPPPPDQPHGASDARCHLHSWLI